MVQCSVKRIRGSRMSVLGKAFAAVCLAVAVFTVDAAPPQRQGAPAMQLLVPYTAGGTIDLMARQLGPSLARSLAREVVVENVPGAGGALALHRLLGSTADGRELAIGTESDAILVPLVNTEARYAPGQFRLIGKLTEAPLALVAGASLPAGTLAETIEENTRRAAKPLRMGSYGVGSSAHVCTEDLAGRTGLKPQHVPYKGIAPLMQDLMAGHVDLAFLPLSGNVAEAVADGRLRVLAVAAQARTSRFPDAPTFAEAIGLQGFVHTSWSGLMAPPAITEPALRRAHAALEAALRDPAFRQALEDHGITPAAPASLAQAQQLMTAEVEKYKRLTAALQARGITFR